MNFKQALDRIKTIADALPDDDPDKLEMLNVEGDFSKLMEWALQKRNEQMAMADANKELAGIYKDREARFLIKANNMKDVIEMIMVCAGEMSYKGAAGTVTVKNNPPKPIVIDESKIPAEYKKITETIDKMKINQAVKDGKQIDGVSMDNGGTTIQIRVK